LVKNKLVLQISPKEELVEKNFWQELSALAVIKPLWPVP
jgi:hypothetical protein